MKTLRLHQCTCGHGYSEDRAIRDLMVELTNDPKLRKDALSKDLTLEQLLKEGEANELARRRASAVEGKSVMQLSMDDDLTEEEANFMIAKLKKAGRFSSRADKSKEKATEPCTRCTNPKIPHQPEKCFFLDKTCHACKETGHMKGSAMCPKTDKQTIKKVSVDCDYDDPTN